jgi:hypothetical protein
MVIGYAFQSIGSGLLYYGVTGPTRTRALREILLGFRQKMNVIFWPLR